QRRNSQQASNYSVEEDEVIQRAEGHALPHPAPLERHRTVFYESDSISSATAKEPAYSSEDRAYLSAKSLERQEQGALSSSL
ncbi:hypothetical protein Pmar_PMAR007468, partial [Perkinsus marinus ATCC 50983]